MFEPQLDVEDSATSSEGSIHWGMELYRALIAVGVVVAFTIVYRDDVGTWAWPIRIVAALPSVVRVWITYSRRKRAAIYYYRALAIHKMLGIQHTDPDAFNRFFHGRDLDSLPTPNKFHAILTGASMECVRMGMVRSSTTEWTRNKHGDTGRDVWTRTGTHADWSLALRKMYAHRGYPLTRWERLRRFRDPLDDWYKLSAAENIMHKCMGGVEDNA